MGDVIGHSSGIIHSTNASKEFGKYNILFTNLTLTGMTAKDTKYSILTTSLITGGYLIMR